MTAARSTDRERVAEALDAINGAWLKRRPAALAPLLHEEITMVYPGFTGRAEGRAAVIASFEEFLETGRVHGFEERDRQIDVVDDVAVASYAFEITYERDGQTYRSTGRDVWVFRQSADRWLAVWRTMLDVADETVTD